MQLSTLLILLAVGTSSVSAGRRERVTRQTQDQPNALVASMVTQNMGNPDARGFPADFGLKVGRGKKRLDSAACQGDKPEDSIPCECPPASTGNATFRDAVKVALNLGFFPDQQEEPKARVSMTLQQWNTLPFGAGPAQDMRNGVMVVALQSLTGVKGVGCPGISAPGLKALGG